MFIYEDDDLPHTGDAPTSDWLGNPWFLANSAVVLVATCAASAYFPLPWFGG